MRNKFEKLCADLLSAQGILYEYEGQTLTLIDKFSIDSPVYQREAKEFKRYHRMVSAIKYTPDFIGDGWVIETKGFESEVSRIKWKLFKRYLKEKGLNVTIFKPHTKNELLQCIEIIKRESPNQSVTCLK